MASLFQLMPNQSSRAIATIALKHVPYEEKVQIRKVEELQAPSNYRGTKLKENCSRSTTGTPSTPNSPKTLEQQRHENAAKRTEMNQKGMMGNGRGGRGGLFTNKQVRFADAATEQMPNPFSNAASPLKSIYSAPTAVASSSGATSPGFTFGAPSKPDTASSSNKLTPAFNPFATAPKNPLNNSNPMLTPFGAPSEGPSAIDPFSNPSTASNLYGMPPDLLSTTLSAFGEPSLNSWGKLSAGVLGANSTPSVFAGTAAMSSSAPELSNSNPFGAPSSTSSTFPSTSTSNFGDTAGKITGSVGSVKNGFGMPNGFGTSANTSTSAVASTSKPSPPSRSASALSTGNPKPVVITNTPFAITQKPEQGTLAARVAQVLEKERIVPPKMPAYDLMYERQLLGVPELMKHLTDYKKYQQRIRTSLMREGVIDDPGKPKNLADAIDFKGTCEEMCPELEKIERLLEGRVDACEKGVRPDGSLTRHAVMEKMVKIHARSSAGQDAPLPSEVRTTAALRRTVDYLMKDVLTESNLCQVHGFLWNRTRALRRDFVFHSYLTSTELLDLVYCLETIARFHSLSLHLMSKPENYSEAFDTYQEFEQLVNTMISLLQAYDDCKAQGAVCENEAEFRAYSILIQRKTHPGLQDMVQNWGWEVYQAKEVKIALSLVEALANTWEMQGPLKPAAQTDVAQNASTRYFEIVNDRNTSYTMACFAEIWFNDAREAIVRTILGSYRKQRDQVKDWTLPRLNVYMRFDDENDIVPWGQARNVTFGEADGVTYLSLEPGSDIDHLQKGKQYHSYPLVERKRGDHSLLEVLYNTVFEEAASNDALSDEDGESLFVKNTAGKDPWPKSVTVPETQLAAFLQSPPKSPAVSETALPPVEEAQPKPASIIDQSRPSIGISGLASLTPTASFLAEPGLSEPKPISSFAHQQPNNSSFFPMQPPSGNLSTSTKPTVNGAPSIFDKPSGQTLVTVGTQASSAFNFLSNPASMSTSTPVTPPSPGNQATAAAASTALFFPKQPSSTSPQLPSLQSRAAAPQVVQTLPPSSQPSVLSVDLGGPQTSTLVESLHPNGKPQLQSNIPKSLSIAPDFQGFYSTQSKSSAPAPPSHCDPWAGLTDWYALGDEGIVDQFKAYEVDKILREAVSQFIEEESQKAAAKADREDQAQADHFRVKSLATKYGLFWREEARIRSLRRKGIENRIARKAMAEESRAARAAQAASVVEEFKASTTGARQRRGSLESLLGSGGVLNGVHDSEREARAIVRESRKSASIKRQRSVTSKGFSPSSGFSKHKRGRSDNPLRRSLMSDPTYLQGGSRIHLIPNYKPDDEHCTQVSGVQTDYFRLKARGVSTLHDGTPLASSAANMLHHKRSFDSFVKSSRPRYLRDRSIPRSVPEKSVKLRESARPVEDEEDDIDFLKARARQVMSEDEAAHRKRSLDEDDEELFARAKRVREQMDEGAEFYRTERESGFTA
ncbi:leucine permease transcriptional regulator [Diplocarpon rosae]|nr:leucine permease transcriptional regulator [Diplocarpon rosae]